uniref:Uncharacterized protein n=1 Tax=Solanum lycopersicum TaxID=4081 RepID=K4AUM0_SOLLC
MCPIGASSWSEIKQQRLGHTWQLSRHIVSDTLAPTRINDKKKIAIPIYFPCNNNIMLMTS